MNKIFLLCVVIFILLPQHYALSINYYMDSADGNNDNSGTSVELAWKDISKINNSTFSPGDSILFNRGDVFRGQLINPSSGTATNKIVYSAYGSGALPIITGLDSLARANFGEVADLIYAIEGTFTTTSMLYQDGEYCNFVSELATANDFLISAGKDSIYVLLDIGETPADFFWEYDVREKCFYSNIKSYFVVEKINFKGTRKNIDSKGIDIRKAVGATIDSLVVEDIYYIKNPTVGGTAWHSKRGYGIFIVNCDSVIVKNCIVQDMTNRGVHFSNLESGFNMQYAEIYSNTFTNLRAAIAVSTSSVATLSGVVVYSNKLNGFGNYYYNSAWEKGFLSVSGGSTTTEGITNVKVYNNYAAGDSVAVWYLFDGRLSGFEVYNNIMLSNLKSSFGFKFVSSTNHIGNHKVYNNTCYTCYMNCNRSAGNEFKNNIFHNTTYYGAVISDAYSQTGLILDNNLYDVGQTNKVWMNGPGNLTLATLRTNGYEVNGLADSTRFLYDPISAYEDTLVYVRDTSPVINAGERVGLLNDYFDNKIWGNPDIGAYEYQLGVNILAPVGGEELVKGNNTNIEWESVNVDSLKIFYSVDGGSNWEVVSTQSYESGSYEWVVPDEITSDGYIKIEQSNNSVFYDITQVPFSILAGGWVGKINGMDSIGEIITIDVSKIKYFMFE